MPVWEKKCPRCGMPIDLDTESSEMYCSYCNTRFLTDEFLHERTKYHNQHNDKKQRSGVLDDWFSRDSTSDSSHDWQEEPAGFICNNNIKQKLWKIKPEESWFFGGCRNLAFFSFALALSGTWLGAIGSLVFLFLGFFLVFVFALPAGLSFLEVAINKKYPKRIGFIRVGTLIATIVFIAGITLCSFVLFKPDKPAWQGTYYPNKATLEQSEKIFDFQATTSCEINEDTYVLTLKTTSPIIIQRHFSGTYTEEHGFLTFDRPDLYMHDNKLYFVLDLQEDGYGIITIEYILSK